MFGLLHEFVVYFFDGANCLDSPACLNDIVYFVEVPLRTDVNTLTLGRERTPYFVDPGQVMQLVKTVILVVHRMSNGKESHIRGFRQSTVKVLRLHICLKAFPPRVDPFGDSLRMCDQWP